MVISAFVIGIMVNLPLAAQATPAAASQPDQIKPFIIMMGTIAILAYILLVRPNKTEQKQRQQMLDTVSKGDQVVTVGGIHGSVEGVDVSKGIVTVTIAPKTTVRVNKTAIASVTRSKSAQGKEGKDNKDEE